MSRREHLCQTTLHADEVRQLQANNAKLRTDYEEACKLVAYMHAAAMGKVTSPVLGVIEDVAALKAEADRLRGVVSEVHSWIVCAGIADAQDMMQNAERILEITTLE